jgi:glutaredoxin 3
MIPMEPTVTTTIYTRPYCGYCTRALDLLRKKGVPVEEIDIGAAPERRAEMRARANGGWTLPQIFIGEKHIGGCDELYDLEDSGELDPMLGLA